MITVYIPPNTEFKKYENDLKEMYEKSQDKICDSNSFEFIRDNTLLYMFVSEGKLLGGIYYFMEDGKLYLNGFAGRKHLKENLVCLKESTTWFVSDIYAEAQNRASAFCLLRCGFQREVDNIFVLRRQLVQGA